MLATEQILYILPRQFVFVVEKWDESDEGRPVGPFVERLTVLQALERIRKDFQRSYRRSKTWGREWSQWLNEAVAKPVAAISEAIRDGYDFGPCQVYTLEGYAKAKSDRRRREIERWLATFQAYVKTSGKDEFALFHALQAAREANQYSRERWEDSETRMEHWGRCRAEGVGIENYYDDLDYTRTELRSDQEMIEEAFRYLREKTPLLYLEWREHQKRKEEG